LFSITSSSSNSELVFSEPRKDYFTVEFKCGEVQAIRKVYAYSPHRPSIGALFARIASQDRPWEGAEYWESLEGEFSLSATCSHLGAVTFSISIHSRPDARDKWRISVTLSVGLGQLPAIGASATQFFGVVAGA